MTENKKRIYRSIESVNKVIDTQTGEVITEQSEQLEMGYVDTEPQYIKIYLDCILRFKGLGSSLNPVLLALCKHMSFADKDQIIFVNKYVKDLVSAECGIKTKRIEQAVKQFVDTGLFMRKARGVYVVNPYIISRGKWEDIKKLRATFDFITGDINVEVEAEEANLQKPQEAI